MYTHVHTHTHTYTHTPTNKRRRDLYSQASIYPLTNIYSISIANTCISYASYNVVVLQYKQRVLHIRDTNSGRHMAGQLCSIALISTNSFLVDDNICWAQQIYINILIVIYLNAPVSQIWKVLSQLLFRSYRPTMYNNNLLLSLYFKDNISHCKHLFVLYHICYSLPNLSIRCIGVTNNYNLVVQHLTDEIKQVIEKIGAFLVKDHMSMARMLTRCLLTY